MISARSAAGSFGSFGMKTAPTRMTASAAAIAKAVISLTSITRSPRTTPAARSARSRPSEYSSRPSPDMASPVSVYSATASGSFVLALAMLIAVSRNRSHPTGSSSGVVLFSVFTLIFQVWRKVRLRTGATLVGLQPQPFRQLAGRPCDRASLSCASRTQFSRPLRSPQMPAGAGVMSRSHRQSCIASMPAGGSKNAAATFEARGFVGC
jgi:hypothetical protein